MQFCSGSQFTKNDFMNSYLIINLSDKMSLLCIFMHSTLHLGNVGLYLTVITMQVIRNYPLIFLGGQIYVKWARKNSRLNDKFTFYFLCHRV